MPFTLKQKVDLAFALALFIRSDRHAAVEVADQALDDYQRFYYLKGKKRDYNWTQYAFPLTENYALQHRVFLEATQVKASALCDQSEAGMITYYLANMLSVCGAKNPFHVTAGFSMRVYDYTDVQASFIYGALKRLVSLPTINPKKKSPNCEEQSKNYMYSNRDQFRNWKRKLSKEIKAQFGDLIEIDSRVPASDRQRNQVKLCSEKFIPWVENGKRDYYDLTAINKTYPDMGEIGVACIHTIVHQESYSNLVKMAKDFFAYDLERDIDGKMVVKGGLPPTEEKLKLPKFTVSSNHSTHDPGPPTPTDEEREEILRRVAARQQNRQVEKGDWIVCYADTDEVCRFRTDQGSASFEVDDTTRLMKFCAEKGDRKNWLVTIPLNLDESLYEDGPVSLESLLNGRKKLSFDLSLRRDSDGDVDGAYVRLEYSEGKIPLRSLADLFGRLPAFEFATWFGKPALTAAAVALLIVAFFLARNMWKPAKQIAITPTPTPRVEVSPNQPEQPHDQPNQPNQTAVSQGDKPLPSLKPPTILRVKLIGETPADKDLLARLAPKVPPEIKVNDIRIRIVSEGEADIELPVKNDSSAPGDEVATLKASDIGLEDVLVISWSGKGANKSKSFEDKVAAKIVELLKQASRQKRK